MKWMLTIVFLSTGVYREPQISEQLCFEAMVEAELTKGRDIWSMTCVDSDDKITARFDRVEAAP